MGIFVVEPASRIVTPVTVDEQRNTVQAVTATSESKPIHPHTEPPRPVKRELRAYTSTQEKTQEESAGFRGTSITVKSVMTAPPVTLPSNASLQEVLKTMDEHAFHHLPIIDLEGKVVRLVAEKDILRAWISGQTPHPENKLVTELNDTYLTVLEDTPLAHAAVVMLEYGKTALAVLRNNQLIGIVTRHDVLKVFLDLGERWA